MEQPLDDGDDLEVCRREYAELSQRYEEVMRELTLQRTRTEAIAKENRRVQQAHARVTEALDTFRAILGDARYFEILGAK